MLVLIKDVSCILIFIDFFIYFILLYFFWRTISQVNLYIYIYIYIWLFSVLLECIFLISCKVHRFYSYIQTFFWNILLFRLKIHKLIIQRFHLYFFISKTCFLHTNTGYVKSNFCTDIANLICQLILLHFIFKCCIDNLKTKDKKITLLANYILQSTKNIKPK